MESSDISSELSSHRTLKANPKLAGSPCVWCGRALSLGDATSMCTSCERPHHQGCWDRHAGCANASCVNAPLRQLAPEVVVSPPRLLPAGYQACRMCRETISTTAAICPFCRGISSPDGIYRGPMVNAPGAVSSLVYGILGLFLCNIILGPVAISKANSARAAMAADPTLGGSGLATAGYVLGIIDLCLFAIFLLARLSS